MLKAPNFAPFHWLTHGFGMRDSQYPAGIVTVRQIHSDRVIAAEAATAESEGDALIAAAGGLVGVRTADCVPILLVDERTRAVAAIHAGWRGTDASIASAAVRQMIALGSRVEDLHAAIGPAIGFCCYEVGPDVERRFESRFESEGTDLVRNRHVDLAGINEWQLRGGGVTDVWKAGACTFCQAGNFFSYRREKERAGRMISFIGSKNRAGGPG